MTGGGLPTPTDRTYPRHVGTPETGPSEPHDEVLLSPTAADTLRKLPEDKVQAVARAIDRIDVDQGRRLKIPPSRSGNPFYAVVAPGKDAPIVIYRPLNANEGKGFLVAAIINRDEYEGYIRADRKGVLDTALAQYILDVAAR